MNFPASHQSHDPVSRFFQAQALLHDRLMVTRHGDGIGIAEEIRRMQHVYVKRMTFNPFSAVEKPSQLPHGRIDRDTEGALDGVYRAHLIRDGTDSADAGDNVGKFREVPAAEKGLEETGRFVDVQLYVLNLIPFELDVKRTFPFDSRQNIYLDRARLLLAHVRSLSSPAFRNCQAQALKLRKARVISALFWPRM